MKHLPKILPWIAKKSGISDELVAKLWRRASGETVELLGETETSELHKRTVERFLQLVQEEAIAEPGSIVTPADFAWMIRHQSRITFLSLLAFESASQAYRNNWSKFIRAYNATTAMHA
jgi:hypothetical protein